MNVLPCVVLPVVGLQRTLRRRSFLVEDSQRVWTEESVLKLTLHDPISSIVLRLSPDLCTETFGLNL